MNDLHLWRQLQGPITDPTDVLPLLDELAAWPLLERAAYLGRLAALADHAAPQVRAAVMKGLSGAHGHTAFRVLVAGLNDEDEIVSRAALEALRRSCLEGDPLRWAHAMFHPRAELRRAAIDPARRFPCDWHLKLHLLPDPECRDLVVQELEQRGVTAEVMPLLFSLLREGALGRERVRRMTQGLSWNAWLSFLEPLLPRHEDLAAELSQFVAQGPEAVPSLPSDRCEEMLALFWDDPDSPFFARLTEGSIRQGLPFRQWMTLKLLLQAARSGTWPQAALNLACVLHPWLLTWSGAEREKRSGALAAFYALGGRCPRHPSDQLVDLLDDRFFFLQGHEQVPDLYAVGALLHAFDSSPYDHLLERVTRGALFAAVHLDFQRSTAILRVPDDGGQGRQRLLELLTSERDMRGPEMLAVLAILVPSDQLDFLTALTPSSALPFFHALLDIEAARPRGLGENKVHHLGNRLAGLLAGQVSEFLEMWLARPSPGHSALAVTTLARLCHHEPSAANIVSHIVALPGERLWAFLEALPFVAGFPYALELQLVRDLKGHTDPRVLGWVRDRGGASQPAATTVPLTISRVGTCAALASFPDGPAVGPCVALLSSNDPLPEVMTQFRRFSSDDDAFVKSLDCEMVRVCRGQKGLPYLGHVWLYRWDEHLALVTKAFVGKSDPCGAVLDSPGAHLRWLLSFEPGALIRRMALALAAVLEQWRWHDRSRWHDALTPELGEALLDALKTPLAEWAIQRLTMWKEHGANSALRDVLNRLSLIVAELPAEIASRLGQLIDLRGVNVSASAPMKKSGEVAALQDIAALVRDASSLDDALAAPAARRLLLMGRQGAEALAGVLVRHPDRTWPLALVPELIAAPGVVQDALRGLIFSPAAVPAVRFRLGMKLYPSPSVDLVLMLLSAIQQPGPVGWLRPEEVDWLVEHYPGSRHEVALALLLSPHPAAHGWAVAHFADPSLVDAEARAALLAFLEVGTERARGLRVQAAKALYAVGERARVLPVLLGEIGGDDFACPALFVGLGANTVEATASGLLALGKGEKIERRLLELADHGHDGPARGWTAIEEQPVEGKDRVDPEARQQAMALLLDQCKSQPVRQEARNRLVPGASRTNKLRALARTFAWGVRLGRQLTGELFDLEMIAGEELGYTRLDQPRLFISPMPILRGEQDAREVVKGLILHEYGHHLYHKSPEAKEVWARAQRDRMHPLLNLVSDEHLERNLRARDEQYGNWLKVLDAYAFQHAAREVAIDDLLAGLGSQAFAVLTRIELHAGRQQGSVRLSAGGLLHRMERAGISFARFLRALRMGLSNRHGDEKVGLALALFKGPFRQANMARLYEIAQELRKIFGEECDLLSCIGQDGVLNGSEEERVILGEGIDNEELQRAIQRALEQPDDEEPEMGNPVRTINLGPTLDFPRIDLIQPQPFFPPRYARLARQVSRQASALRQYLTKLGLALEPQRQRVQGKLVDRGRIRSLVLRGDPRFLIARQVQFRTDLFLGVVIDCSGSMSMDRNIDKAKLFGALLAEAARGMRGIDLRLWGFTDRRIYDCGDANRPAIHDLEASEGNNDAAALYHAAQEARASRRRARLLVMISDGSPTECTVESLRNLVKQLTTRQGFLCAQVAVRPLEHVCFPHYVLLQESHIDACVKRFGAVVMGLVRQALGS